jgi:hypothetical protein
VADKTGSDAYGTINDIKVLFPPRRAPVLVSSYLTGIKANSPIRGRPHLGWSISVLLQILHISEFSENTVVSRCFI